MSTAHWAGARTWELWPRKIILGLPFLPCHTQLDKLQALPLGSLACSTCRGLSLTLLSPSPQFGKQRATAVPHLSLTPASPFGRNLRMAKVWLVVRGAGVARESGCLGHPSPPGPLQATPSTCGSSSWHFCKTGTPAPSTSSGPSERKASSSWWTPKLCQSSGGSRRTSLT